MLGHERNIEQHFNTMNFTMLISRTDNGIYVDERMFKNSSRSLQQGDYEG